MNGLRAADPNPSLTPSPPPGRVQTSIANREEKLLKVELDDLQTFDDEVAGRACANAQRYIKLFEKAADDLLKTIRPTKDIRDKEDILDVLHKQRLAQARAARDAEGHDDATLDVEDMFPAALRRRYEVRLIPRTKATLGLGAAGGGGGVLAYKTNLRDVKASHIGALVRVEGIVTRVSDVKPLVEVATYTCDCCGFEIYQEVGFKQSFTPLPTCPSSQCMDNKMQGRLFMQTRSGPWFSTSPPPIRCSTTGGIV